MPKKIRIVVSLTTNDNDYQIEQAQSAEQAAARLGVTAEIIYADNDAITQSQLLLQAIQTKGKCPEAISETPGATSSPPAPPTTRSAASLVPPSTRSCSSGWG